MFVTRWSSSSTDPCEWREQVESPSSLTLAATVPADHVAYEASLGGSVPPITIPPYTASDKRKQRDGERDHDRDKPTIAVRDV